MPRIVKGEVMQACSSGKTRLVELSGEETQVDKRCEVVDLECNNCEKEICETETFTSSNCFNTIGLIEKLKVPESKGSASSSVSKKGGDNKQASASTFLSQVRSHHHTNLFMFCLWIFGSHATCDLYSRSKEKLNGEEEYNKFVGYMQGLKKKELKLANVMQSIGTERDHLLMGFKDFVPVKHRPAYEQ